MRRPLLALLLLAAAPASAAELDLLGPARAISHSSSASRDTFALSLLALPHRVLSGGGDFGVLSLSARGLTLRLGVQAMMELESEGEVTGFDGMPVADIHFWRGVWGYSAALSLDDLATRWLGARGALEATFSLRHESEHYTGSNEGGDAIDYSDRPHVGNFAMLDLAARVPVGDVDLVARLQEKQFLGGGGYRLGPGFDLHARWRRWPRLHPFASLFGELLVGRDRYPDDRLLRGLLGVILPSRAGDIYLFLSADVGNRKGLAVTTEERTLGLGVRFAFY